MEQSEDKYAAERLENSNDIWNNVAGHIKLGKSSTFIAKSRSGLFLFMPRGKGTSSTLSIKFSMGKKEERSHINTK